MLSREELTRPLKFGFYFQFHRRNVGKTFSRSRVTWGGGWTVFGPSVSHTVNTLIEKFWRDWVWVVSFFFPLLTSSYHWAKALVQINWKHLWVCRLLAKKWAVLLKTWISEQQFMKRPSFERRKTCCNSISTLMVSEPYVGHQDNFYIKSSFIELNSKSKKMNLMGF